MRTLRWPALFGVLALIGTGAAVASMGGSPRTDPVVAEINAVRTQVIAEAFCPGQDGFYGETMLEFRGTVASSDPRMRGDLVLVTRTLLNQTTGVGVGRHSGVLTDPATGRVKAKLRLTTVISPGFAGNGLIEAQARSGGDLPGGVLVANYTSVFDPTARVFHAELGSGNTGAKNGANTAVLQRGSCGLDASADTDENGDD